MENRDSPWHTRIYITEIIDNDVHVLNQDCRLLVFIMTPRSTNSQYCHDEVYI